ALMNELDQLSEQGDLAAVEGTQRARSRSHVSVLAPLPEDAAEAASPTVANLASISAAELLVAPTASEATPTPQATEQAAEPAAQSAPGPTPAPQETVAAPAAIQVNDVVVSEAKFMD